MNLVKLQSLYADVISRFGVRPDAAKKALLATLEHFRAESHNSAAIRAGFTPDKYLDVSLTTRRFAATFSSGALMADGRSADARLHWEAYVQREAEAARLAHKAVPSAVLLGNPTAVHRIGREIGLSAEQTDRFISRIVLTLAVGYPYRPAHQQNLSLTDMLGQTTAEELAGLLRHTALLEAGRSDEAADVLRRMQRKPR